MISYSNAETKSQVLLAKGHTVAQLIQERVDPGARVMLFRKTKYVFLREMHFPWKKTAD